MSPSRTARSTHGAAARGGPAGDAPRTPRPASAPPAGTDRPRQPGPGFAGPPPPRRVAPLTWAVRLLRVRCTFCWNWRCSRGSSARSGAALTAVADADSSAAMADSAAMLPPRGRRKCVTALAPGLRGRRRLPATGRAGPRAAPPGPAPPHRQGGSRHGHRQGDKLPPWERPLAPSEAISTLWAPSQPIASVYSWLLRPLRRCAGQHGAARSGCTGGSLAPAARKAPWAGSGGTMSVSEMFAALQGALGQDQDIREVPGRAGRARTREGTGRCLG